MFKVTKERENARQTAFGSISAMVRTQSEAMKQTTKAVEEIGTIDREKKLTNDIQWAKKTPLEKLRKAEAGNVSEKFLTNIQKELAETNRMKEQTALETFRTEKLLQEKTLKEKENKARLEEIRARFTGETELQKNKFKDEKNLIHQRAVENRATDSNRILTNERVNEKKIQKLYNKDSSKGKLVAEKASELATVQDMLKQNPNNVELKKKERKLQTSLSVDLGGKGLTGNAINSILGITTKTAEARTKETVKSKSKSTKETLARMKSLGLNSSHFTKEAMTKMSGILNDVIKKENGELAIQVKGKDGKTSWKTIKVSQSGEIKKY